MSKDLFVVEFNANGPAVLSALTKLLGPASAEFVMSKGSFVHEDEAQARKVQETLLYLGVQATFKEVKSKYRQWAEIKANMSAERLARIESAVEQEKQLQGLRDDLPEEFVKAVETLYATVDNQDSTYADTLSAMANVLKLANGMVAEAHVPTLRTADNCFEVVVGDKKYVYSFPASQELADACRNGKSGAASPMGF